MTITPQTRGKLALSEWLKFGAAIVSLTAAAVLWASNLQGDVRDLRMTTELKMGAMEKRQDEGTADRKEMHSILVEIQKSVSRIEGALGTKP